MKLGPTEQARLLVFQVAELARRQRDRGLRLNAPEAIAIASDEMHMAARAGASFDEVLQAGMAAVSSDDLMDGVAPLVAEIRVEVLLREGTRLIVLRDLGAAPSAARGPGATALADAPLTLNEGLLSVELEVTNDSDHAIRISSHFPFDRVNRRLRFDREAARASRLDVPAGDTVRWAPGETKTVRLVRVAPEDVG